MARFVRRGLHDTWNQWGGKLMKFLLAVLIALSGCSSKEKPEKPPEYESKWKIEYTVNGVAKSVVVSGKRPRMFTVGGGIGVANNTTVVVHGGDRIVSVPVDTPVSVTEVLGEER